MAMGQNPVPPVNISIPTKIGSKMGGAPTNRLKWVVNSPTPKWDPIGVDPRPNGMRRQWPRNLLAGAVPTAQR